MHIPKISVVMSVYNAENYLKKSIESILKQSYKNFEFIIVNDGSDDNSLEIIKYYMLFDNRIILINQKNKGLTKSLNIGIERAAGEYIARQDADDISMPGRFELFLKFVENNNVDIYTTPALLVNESNVLVKKIPNYFRRNGFHHAMLDYYNSLIHGTLIIKASLIKNLKYNEDFEYSQDFELYHRLMKAEYSISYDKNNISYKLRVHSNSVSNMHSLEQAKLYKKIFNDNNLKFYKISLLNKVLFKMIDVFYYFLAKSKKNKE